MQDGLTTCMELTAKRRPFLYVPLAHHFEQNFHVAHRLDRYRSVPTQQPSAAQPHHSPRKAEAGQHQGPLAYALPAQPSPNLGRTLIARRRR
jgi:hypothetical protein